MRLLTKGSMYGDQYGTCDPASTGLRRSEYVDSKNVDLKNSADTVIGTADATDTHTHSE